MNRILICVLLAMTAVAISGSPSPQDQPKWVPIASISTPRRAEGVAGGLNGLLYAFGGLDAAGCPLNSAEVYTPSLNHWTAIAPMSDFRTGPATATGTDGRIYAIGGFTNGLCGFGVYLSSVEAYTASTNKWDPIVPMSTPRHL